MYYVVFSRQHNADDSLTSNLYYKGASKSAALEAFSAPATRSFNINALAGSLYFVGFGSDLPFVKEIIKKASSLPSQELINTVLRNLGLATCLNTLTVSGYRPSKLIVVNECEECDNKDETVQQNVYKDYLCSSCWTAYAKTRRGLAEFVFGIANGTCKPDSFSETDLSIIVSAWQNNEINDDDMPIPKSSNRALLLKYGTYTEDELDAIEAAFEAATGKTFKHEEEEEV